MAAQLQQALEAFPVVVLTGARQTGKTTLVRAIDGASERRYLTLDDLDVLERATDEPDLLVRSGSPLTLDEVQRVPDLLRAVKRAVDLDRRPGAFLLTGSANLLLMRAVSESLAGRAVYLTLGPLTEREKEARAKPAPWGALLEARSARDAEEILRAETSAMSTVHTAVIQGGMPAVLHMDRLSRGRWFEGYVATYLERDLQQLASIADLADFRRLLRLCASRTGGLLNQASLGREAGLTRPTTHRWINLLAVSFQVRLLPAYTASRSKRLVRSPKLYLGDTGLATHLAGIGSSATLRGVPNAGGFVENLILNHLDVWRETMVPKPEILFWRTAEGTEVDFVIEHGDTLLPVEVKTSSRARRDDASGIECFLESNPSGRYGLILYGGSEAQLVTDRIVAAPIGSVL